MKPAPSTRRMAASALDMLWIACYAALLGAVGYVFRLLLGLTGAGMAPWAVDLLAFFTLVLPVILYFSSQESSPRQATWGKRLVGIRVGTFDGARLSRFQSLFRSAVKFSPWQLAHSCVIRLWLVETSPLLIAGAVLAQLLVVVNLLSMLLLKDHRALHDRISGTYVTKARGRQEGARPGDAD